jgi:hypothetical protein
MIEPAECRERAKDCAEHAQTEANEKMRLVYSNLARSWAAFANQIERQREVERWIAEQKLLP